MIKCHSFHLCCNERCDDDDLLMLTAPDWAAAEDGARRPMTTLSVARVGLSEYASLSSE